MDLPGPQADDVHRLLVVPTPIGNLEDITVRALRALGDVGLILAEDTRLTSRLLRHHGISTPLRSYHQHNKRERIDETLKALQSQDVAVVASAGTPAIADPGYELIAAAVAEGVPVDVLPGPSAVPTAVVAAALPAPGFLFIGFLPRKSPDRQSRLRDLASLPYSLVIFEAPHRLRFTLRDIRLALGNRQVVACREMTKIYQEYIRGTVEELEDRYRETAPRGEYTLVIAGGAEVESDRSSEAELALRAWIDDGINRQTALGRLAQEYGVTRNRAYQMWLAQTMRRQA